MLSCNNLIIQRAGRALTQPISFSLLPGAILQLTGANGVGKSTLLQMLAGIIPTNADAITFADQSIQNDMEYRTEVALLTHQHGLRLASTVRENLEIWGKLYDETARILSAVAFWQLEDVLEKPVQELSAGWRQRVALARMMLKPAVIWLLDEPTSNLDIAGRELLWQLIATRANRSGIVVLTSHESQIPISHITQISLDDYAVAQKADASLRKHTITTEEVSEFMS
jgi:heme exporter protein A